MAPVPHSPTNTKGFIPLPNMSNQQGLRSEDHIVNIPLTPIETNVSTGARKEGHTADPNVFKNDVQDVEDTGYQRHIGRRRARQNTMSSDGAEEGALTTMGKIYDKLLNFSIVTRYLIYILPLSLCFLVVILVCHLVPEARGKVKIGTVPLKWFFVWLEIVWCSLWISKLVAKALPFVFQALVGVVSSGVKKYSMVIKALEIQISLVGWAIASLCSFIPLMTKNPDVKQHGGKVFPWQDRVNKVLISCLVSTIVYLVEKVLIQIVSVDYHRRQFAQRIKENKNNVRFLASLYEVSRNLFPEYTEFAEEDYIIHQGLAGSVIPGRKKKSGTATPMRQLIGNVNIVQDRITSVFGNIAQEVTGNKNVFNPSSSYATVLEALVKKSSSEALARRIWMSFVPENSSALTKADLLEVMGPAHHEQADECFSSLDKDGNGDVSLDEMVQHVLHCHTERYAVAKSMRDVDNAIGALNNVLMFIVLVIVILIFVIAQQASVGTTLAGFGTVLISLSFVFSITAQEVLGSTIFLFVKHPYDVGDRVDMDGSKYIVEQISLLYTVFKKVECGKTAQWPNNILNTKQIENVSRSKFMQEQITVSVHFDTKYEDIQKLRQELYMFMNDNSRDFVPDLDNVEVTGINKLDLLELRIYIKHRGNWANELQTAQRRSKFFCALADIFRKIPIYAPGGGDPSLGEQGKPMYYVPVSDEQAREQMEKAKVDKLSKRWDYESSSSDSDSDSGSSKKSKKGKRKSQSEHNSASSTSTAVGLDLNTTGHRTRSPFSDSRTPHNNLMHSVSGRRSTDTHTSHSRREDIEEVRGLLHAESVRGRRKPVPGSQQHTPFHQ
ncbi:hypothetical protein EX30DRAFT_266358 [Ascodesmis nigricans]|uniref:Mechanosensitive ion channel protein n=1 Tax=Ascodesmis nigricans TaxID=341454 RepID=A0A4S2MPG2_9PEZI|nr:hypothetical protein EX30DRAFT_266358 [Ascodesmis nigricans]